jgi:hypothetical protein
MKTIRHILTQIASFFDVEKREREADYKYLEQSTSRADLERRMRELEMRGKI